MEQMGKIFRWKEKSEENSPGEILKLSQNHKMEIEICYSKILEINRIGKIQSIL